MDSINLSLSAINSTNFYPEKTLATGSKTTAGFDEILQAFMGTVQETNAYQLAAEQAQLDLASGKTDDVLAVTLAQDRAYNSLNFTVQVTNKIIESYRQIMQLQI